MDHITDMRKVLAIVALLASSACGTATGWQKPGTEQSLVDGDLRQCRRAAVQETMRLFADWRPFRVRCGCVLELALSARAARRAAFQ